MSGTSSSRFFKAMNCEGCGTGTPMIRHSMTLKRLCRKCFLRAIEDEVQRTVEMHSLVRPGESIALGVSGGKDSSVMLHILHTLRLRCQDVYDGVRFVMVAVNEGIQGYRGESLACLQRLHKKYPYELEIVGFEERYGRTLDQLVNTVNGNSCTDTFAPLKADLEDVNDTGRPQPTAKTATACSFCGILRRNSLSYGSLQTQCTKVATGHNADDNAETVLLNLIRGDAAKLVRCSEPLSDLNQGVARIKPLCNIAQRDIVIYAHLQRLDYFSVECPYATTALRGKPRSFLTNLCTRPAYSDAALRIIRSTRKLRLKTTHETQKLTSLHLCPSCQSPVSTTRCQCCDIRTAKTGDDLKRAAKCRP